MLKLDEDFLKRMNAPQIDLDEEYKKALKNENFKEMVKELNLDEEILKKYTTNLMECANDYSNCKTCPNIMECKNKVKGYAYLPTNIDNHIEFGYKSCKYLNKLNEENKYSDNVTLIGANSYLKNARMKDIYTDDKSRFNCIKWLNNFIKTESKSFWMLFSTIPEKGAATVLPSITRELITVHIICLMSMENTAITVPAATRSTAIMLS